MFAVIQGSDGLGFPPESFTELRGAKLDGDCTIEPRVARLPHLSHATFANSGNDLVRAEFCSDGEWHLRLTLVYPTRWSGIVSPRDSGPANCCPTTLVG